MSADTPKPGRKHKTWKPPISAREIRFVQLVFEGSSTLSKCYLDAGFPPRPTKHATEQAAHKLVKKAEIRAYYRELQRDAMEAAKVTAASVVRGLAWSANKDLRRLYDERGRILLPHEWPDDVAGFVEGVESEEIFETVTDVDPDTNRKRRRKELVGYVRKVKTSNRTEAQKVLAQMKRLVGQDAERSGGPPPPLVVGGEADPGAL